MSSKLSRGQLVFRSSLLYVWATRGPFGRLPKSLCDFGDRTPHMLVGGAQTTLTVRAIVRADRRDDPREAWEPQGATQSRPPEALDRCTGSQGPSGRPATRGIPPTCVYTSYAGKGLTPRPHHLGLLSSIPVPVYPPSCGPTSNEWRSLADPTETLLVQQDLPLIITSGATRISWHPGLMSFGASD